MLEKPSENYLGRFKERLYNKGSEIKRDRGSSENVVHWATEL